MFVAFDKTTGKWDDVRCKKRPDLGYEVFLGERRLGSVLPLRGEGWTALSPYDRTRTVRGLLNRRKAIEHLLRASGVWDAWGPDNPPTY